MSLVAYTDTPEPMESAGDEAPASAGTSNAAAPAPASGLLSIVDYRNGDKPPMPARDLGVSLDDDDIVKSGTRRLGSVQVSIVKRSAKLAVASDADGTTSSTPDAPPPKEDVRPSFQVPPSPPGECNPKVMAKFLGFVKSSTEGNRVNDYIRNSKRFRNPDLLEKLVAFMDVVENGSNYPSEIYDPTAVEPQEFYEELERARREYEERQSRKPGERVQFHSSGLLEQQHQQQPRAAPSGAAGIGTSTAAPPAAATDASVVKRKSKWDTGGGDKKAKPSLDELDGETVARAQ
jgi:hypothetical protein